MTYEREVFTIVYKTPRSRKPKTRTITGHNGMTLDDVWAFQYNWFSPGTTATITDEHKRSKKFKK